MKDFKMSAVMSGDKKGELWIEGELLPQGWADRDAIEELGLDYSSPEAFKADLGDLDGAEEITVHLNSVGGSALTGLSIYNALKAHPAKVTVVIEGFAASAASLIACASDKTLIYPASMVMIHSCGSDLCGYYDENATRKELNARVAINKMAATIYAEKTDLGETVLRNMMNSETWLVGEEAVALGFADKVIEGEARYDYDAASNVIMCGGAKIDASRFKNLPSEVIMNNILRRLVASLSAKTDEELKAELTEPTADVVDAEVVEEQSETEQAPETAPADETQTEAEDAEVRAAKAVAKSDVGALIAQAVMTERNRIRDIDKVAAVIGDKAMVEEAKFGEQTMTADELSRKWLEASAAKAAKVKADIAADYEASGAAEVKVASSDDETAAKVAAAYKAAVDKFNEERQ